MASGLRWAVGTLLISIAACPSATGRERAHFAALESIRADQLLGLVEVLADDAYEGRAAGSRGGRAAADYVVERLRRMGAPGAAPEGGYYQPVPGGGRNLLAAFPGSDPAVADEWIIVGAHYDHVGYGNRRTSFGPIGYIHNGADDNASGVAALIEFTEAMAASSVRFRRSVLVAFWDAEEVGLVGSKRWIEQARATGTDIRLNINLDMVGRLRDGRLEVVGTRTGFGLRRLASVVEDDGLWLDFTWELESNSDHWSFISAGVPALMLHTGLHDEYHRPSDDVETLNIDGIRTVGRYLFDLVAAASAADTLPAFRAAGRSETPATQRGRERPLPPLDSGAPKPRVGLSWREDAAEPGVVLITRVIPETPAEAAGLRLFDRVQAIDGRPFAESVEFERRLQSLLASGATGFVLQTERNGRVTPVRVRLD